MASHESHDTEHAAHDTKPTTKSSSSAALWFVILLVGLFIASLNFIDVMSHSGGHEESDEANIESISHSPNSETPSGTAAATEAAHESAPAAKDTTAAHAH